MTAVLHDQAAETRGLVDAAKTGDREAYGRLYAEYWPMVRRYIAYRVHNLHTVEDLTQDVFRRALTGIANYEHRGTDIGAWFTTCARNIVVDYFKSGASRLMVPAGTDVYYDGQVDDDEWVSPERRVVRSEAAAALWAAVARLNDEQRQCIELRFLRGFSVAETAEAMGKNEGAIKALQYRARHTLARDPELEALR